MDSGALLTKVKKLLGSSVLESGRFSRGGDALIWVSAGALLEAIQKLKADTELQLTSLENLSAMHLEGAIVLSYFLRSVAVPASGLVVRCSLEPRKTDPRVRFASVREIFEAAAPQEREIAELFGVDFGEAAGESRGGLLPAGWEGFPLRKDYAFPRAFLGIPHVRNAPATGDA